MPILAFQIGRCRNGLILLKLGQSGTCRALFLNTLQNQIYPELDVVGSYAFTGAGPGYTDALNGIQKGNSPSWTVGVQLTLPLGGNRSAQETYRLQQGAEGAGFGA